MSAVSADVEDVAAAVDFDQNRATVSVTQRRTVEVADLFDEAGELRLWQDSQGWSGLLREEGEFFRVNYHARSGEFIEKNPLSEDDVRVAIARHVRDPEAGGVGNFVRRCSPP